MYDAVIIGGGAAGLMAAGTACKNNKKVLVSEKNSILGKKLLITGKGRCNVTNSADISEFFDFVVRNKNFMYSAFYTFTNEDLMKLISDMGTPLKTERGNRVFPVSDRSADIVSALKKYSQNADFVYKKVKEILIENGEVKGVKLEDGSTIECENVIVATGGLSYPKTGSTGDGYRFAKKAGHTVTELKPSLVPLIVKEKYPSDMQGLSLKNIGIKILNKSGKVIYDDFGEMLFTHFGVSGPVILSGSSHLKDNENYTLCIDLKPALTLEKLEKRILSDFEKYINKDFQNSLNDLLPKKMIPVIIERCGIPGEKKVNVITKEERKALLELIKNFTLTITGKGDISEAIITEGGVNVKEINPSTMESKLVKGLYFAGEVLDVNAYTGGFNLQIAFSTGYLAGMLSK